jgi:hypothetical protein
MSKKGEKVRDAVVFPQRRLTFVFTHPTLGDSLAGSVFADAFAEYNEALRADDAMRIDWQNYTAANGVSIQASAADVVLEDDAPLADAAAIAERDALPDMPLNVQHVMRRIRRCENETAAQVVLEHFAREYARAALATTEAPMTDAIAPTEGAVETVKIYETYSGQNGWLEVSQEEYDRTKDKYEHRIRRVPAPSPEAPAPSAPSDAAAEPVAYTTAERLKKIAERNRHVDTMWPASMRDEGDIPLYTAPPAPSAPAVDALTTGAVGFRTRQPGFAWVPWLTDDQETIRKAIQDAIDHGAEGEALYANPAPSPKVPSVEQPLTDRVRALFQPWPEDELGPTDEPQSQYRFGYNTAIEDALGALQSAHTAGGQS